MKTNRSLACRAEGSPGMEALEARAMLAADFVGVAYACEVSLFDGRVLDDFVGLVNGRLEDDGALSQTVRVSQDSGGSGPLQFSPRTLEWLGDGRFSASQRGDYFADPGVYPEPGVGTGAEFLRQRGYPLGWESVQYTGPGVTGIAQSVAYYMERATSATIQELQGDWLLTGIATSNADDLVVNILGNWRVSGNQVSGTIDAFGGTIDLTDEILSVRADGAVTLRDNGTGYVSEDGNTFVLADLSEADGHGMYIGFRAPSDAVLKGVAGRYRMSQMFAGDGAYARGDVEVYAEDGVLDLRGDGTFALYATHDFDSGASADPTTGTWNTYFGRLELTSSEWASSWLIRVGADGTLFPLQDRGFPTTGAGTRTPPPGALEREVGVVTSLAAVESGMPAVYQQGTDAFWRRTALQGEMLSDVVSWTDPKDGAGYAAGLAPDGLRLYDVRTDSTWTTRNLTTETGGQPIASRLEVLVGADGLVHLVGLDAEGDLLRYSQTGGGGPHAYAWTFTNVAVADLEANGEAMPAFAEDIVAYATSWGGLNVAGLDASGRIWSVWWAPGAPRWSATDLSASHNAPPLAGGLTVYLTPWDGINIAGLDAAGAVRAVWWVPGFGGEWRLANLTAEVGGEGFERGSISSYVSSWGGLNIVGRHVSTGETVVYWWAPERTALGWASTSLSGALPGGTPLLATQLRGVASPDGSLNVHGRSADGHLFRYFWFPGFAGTWLVQDITTLTSDLG